MHVKYRVSLPDYARLGTGWRTYADRITVCRNARYDDGLGNKKAAGCSVHRNLQWDRESVYRRQPGC